MQAKLVGLVFGLIVAGFIVLLVRRAGRRTNATRSADELAAVRALMISWPGEPPDRPLLDLLTLAMYRSLAIVSVTAHDIRIRPTGPFARVPTMTIPRDRVTRAQVTGFVPGRGRQLVAELIDGGRLIAGVDFGAGDLERALN